MESARTETLVKVTAAANLPNTVHSSSESTTGAQAGSSSRKYLTNIRIPRAAAQIPSRYFSSRNLSDESVAVDDLKLPPLLQEVKLITQRDIIELHRKMYEAFQEFKSYNSADGSSIDYIDYKKKCFTNPNLSTRISLLGVGSFGVALKSSIRVNNLALDWAYKIASPMNPQRLMAAKKALTHEYQILKSIHIECRNQGLPTKGIQKEIDNLIKLPDDNLCYVTDVYTGTMADEKFFVLSFEEKLQYFLPLFQGLETLASLGVIHHDIKPENIYFDETTNSYVIADFGGAKYLSNTHLHNATGICTEFYTSPQDLKNYEDFEAEGTNNDDLQTLCLKHDIYSLAMTLLVCLYPNQFQFNQPVPGKKTIEKIFKNHVLPTPTIGPLLHDLLTKMLAANYWERPSAAEARDAYQEICARLNLT